MPNRILTLLFILLCLTVTQSSADTPIYAKPFHVGWSWQPTSLNPQYKESLLANHQVIRHFFEPLYQIVSGGKLIPILVESHKVEDPYHWLFTLKKKVYFHNGRELTADDVIATFDRLYQQDKQNPFRMFVGEGVYYEKVSQYQFRIQTPKPNPELLRSLTDINILSQEYAQANESDFSSGKALVGTGPYKFIRQDDMKRFEFKAFQQYHAQQPYLQQVVAHVITDNQRRIQAFQRGELDLIDAITSKDMEAILKHRKAKQFMSLGTKLYHISLDQHRDISPNITDDKGQALTKNPLKDHRVREAISKAINRKKVLESIYTSNGASPIGQLVSPHFMGSTPSLKPEQQDIKKAKALLTEAGYPKGFRITLHDKHARRPLLEAIAEMLNKVGIKAQVKTRLPEEYFPKLLRGSYSAGLSIYDASGNIKSMLGHLIKTNGMANSGGYSNLLFDQKFKKATETFDPDLRYREYSYAAEIAMRDYAIIPLILINDAWAIHKDMAFTVLPEGYTLAQQVVAN